MPKNAQIRYNMGIMKTTKIDCGIFTLANTDVELAESLFGPDGTQRDRRWFYRLYNTAEWHIKGRRSSLRLVLYFRHSQDAVFFALKKSN